MEPAAQVVCLPFAQHASQMQRRGLEHSKQGSLAFGQPTLWRAAPLLSSSSTTPSRPLAAASISGVLPSCGRATEVA
jgi:hypothetical protein